MILVAMNIIWSIRKKTVPTLILNCVWLNYWDIWLAFNQINSTICLEGVNLILSFFSLFKKHCILNNLVFAFSNLCFTVIGLKKLRHRGRRCMSPDTLVCCTCFFLLEVYVIWGAIETWVSFSWRWFNRWNYSKSDVVESSSRRRDLGLSAFSKLTTQNLEASLHKLMGWCGRQKITERQTGGCQFYFSRWLIQHGSFYLLTANSLYIVSVHLNTKIWSHVTNKVMDCFKLAWHWS